MDLNLNFSEDATVIQLFRNYGKNVKTQNLSEAKNRYIHLKEDTLSYLEQKSVCKSDQRVQRNCSLKLIEFVRSCLFKFLVYRI